MKNKIGILGGTFNPIHLGHIELGQKVQAAFELDKILYVLSAHPPHKSTADIAPTEIRWRMLTQALKPFPHLIACNKEIQRTTLSYTWDTFCLLKSDYAQDQLYFISGSEGFLNIRSWKNYRQLLKSVSFIVVMREADHQQKLNRLLAEEGIQSSSETILDEVTARVYFFSYLSPLLHISSTFIRNLIKTGQNVDHLLKKEVKKIVEGNHLYVNG